MLIQQRSGPAGGWSRHVTRRTLYTTNLLLFLKAVGAEQQTGGSKHLNK